MSHRSLRSFCRLLLLALAASTLAACHFHDHCGGGHYHRPIRFCR